ncbi:MAG TPA: hypothetical protein PKD17_10200, partial [Cellvibrionaceae bacterium]|nr:hypothetical protein [Cellvibrionaceae bacterium]
LRGIFSDRFALALGQLNRQVLSQAPRRVVLHRPLIQRQQRLLWLNADLDTLVDLNPLLTADRLEVSLKRLGLLVPGAHSELWLPPDLALLHLLKAQLPVPSLVKLRLHPWALRQLCLSLAAQARGDELAAALVALAQAPSAQAARQALEQLLAAPRPAGPPKDIARALAELASLQALLGEQALAAFDAPALPLDSLLTQLDERLAGSLAKRSFDAVCALLLLDKSLQVSARTGLAREGRRLDYQKAHYGTSLVRLLAKLAQLLPL